jgi:secreted Zn-dependent insulinase-like peptidase
MTQHSVFNQLRTKEQLGYIVSVAVWHAATFMGWRIRIQSERDPEYLESRVDSFLINLETQLGAISEEEFNKYKLSLIALKEEKSRNLSDETTKFWSAIQSGYCDFMRGAFTRDIYFSHLTNVVKILLMVKFCVISRCEKSAIFTQRTFIRFQRKEEKFPCGLIQKAQLVSKYPQARCRLCAWNVVE